MQIKSIVLQSMKLIGIGIFLWILLQIDRTELLETIGSTNGSLFITSFALLYLLYVMKTLRWHLFVRSAGIDASFSESWKLFHIGFFLSTITPGKIGEFGKSIYLVKSGMPKTQAIGIVILDRLCDIAVILLLTIAAIGILFGWPYAVLLLAIELLCCPIIIWILSTSFTLRTLLHTFGYQTFIPSLRTLTLTLTLTLLGWILYFTWAMLIARSIGIETPLHVLMSAFTLTGIVSLLPIAPSGLGTRDITLLTLLAPYGVAAPQIVSLSFLMFVSILLSSVVGMRYWYSSAPQPTGSVREIPNRSSS
jgi:glycosyltransferase 2 family protein